MPVSVMLRTLSSRELTEWRAYEVKNGPLDDAWRDEAMANVVDLVRQLSYLVSQASFGKDSKGRPVQGPVDPPKKPYLRPQYTFLPEPEPTEAEIEEEDARQVSALNAALDDRETKERKKG